MQAKFKVFFDIPVDNLYASKVLLEYLKELEGDKVVVSPDAGGMERARAFAKKNLIVAWL